MLPNVKSRYLDVQRWQGAPVVKLADESPFFRAMSRQGYEETLTNTMYCNTSIAMNFEPVTCRLHAALLYGPFASPFKRDMPWIDGCMIIALCLRNASASLQHVGRTNGQALYLCVAVTCSC